MANTIAGMFADPNSFRDERLNDLMKQRQAIGQMGGSMNQLLGQVAAGGGATGAMMAEGLGGMFGMKTAEEAKAHNIKNLFDETVAMSDGEFNLDTAENLNYFAKKLNDLGYAKEAMQMLEAAQKRREEGLQKRLTEAKVKVAEEGQFKPVVIGTTTNSMGDTITVRKLYNEVTGEFRNLDGTPYSPNQPAGQGGGGAIDKAAIAKNVEAYLKGLEKQRIQGENETNPFAIQDQ